MNNIIDTIFTPPKLTKHECDSIKEDYQYKGIIVGIFKGHSDWFVHKDGQMLIPIIHCPYCGVKL